MGDVCGINRKDYGDGKESIPQGYIYATLLVQPCHLVAHPVLILHKIMRKENLSFVYCKLEIQILSVLFNISLKRECARKMKGGRKIIYF